MQPFAKKLYDQIGSTWYREIQANSQKVALGTVRIRLITSSGSKIVSLRVLSNTSNQLLAQISLKAIRAAKISPVPAELLSHGKFEDDLTFTMFPR
jgi:outer membrane biosynthesis protein TonB